jgi:hypothetical protein
MNDAQHGIAGTRDAYRDNPAYYARDLNPVVNHVYTALQSFCNS